jgi:ribosomal protein S30
MPPHGSIIEAKDHPADGGFVGGASLIPAHWSELHATKRRAETPRVKEKKTPKQLQIYGLRRRFIFLVVLKI